MPYMLSDIYFGYADGETESKNPQSIYSIMIVDFNYDILDWKKKLV